MILTQEKLGLAATLPVGEPSKSCSNHFALSQDEGFSVDCFAPHAPDYGGSEPKRVMDLGFLYRCTVADSDNNTFGPFWMEPPAMQG
jgi:uncharacterized protein